MVETFLAAEPELRQMPYRSARGSEEFMLKKIGKKYVLFTSDGARVLGQHDTKAAAVAQERAIQIGKARRAKPRTTQRPRATPRRARRPR